MEKVACKQCGEEMKKGTKAEKNYGMQVLGVILFLAGGWLIFAGPGPLIGVPLMIAALFMGYSKKRVMKCGGCGYFFEIV